MERDRPWLVLLTSHWLSWLGLVLAITATCTWLFFLPAEIQGHVENPYKGGVVLYLILPVILFCAIWPDDSRYRARPTRNRLAAQGGER
jgi:hypothetical protein